ncbi:MAG TPA: MFS transporter [Thermotogota bacterium]|nr:MFS transporter [Thermotogota bacterium]HRW92923.1 MFS transporter [Thermotogota bacterium]
MKKNEKVSLATKLFFGAGDIFGGGAFNIVNFFYAIFLTDVVKLNMVYVAPIFLIGKVWDAVTDPFMGQISDHTRTRWGRRRPYFLAGIGLIFLSFFLLWFPVDFAGQGGRFAYVLGAYLFFNTVVTLVMVPYQAMTAEISLDYHERTSINSIRLIFSLGSSLVCALFPMMIVNRFSPDVRTGYIVMALVFGVLFALPWIGVFAVSKERKEFQGGSRGFSLKQMIVQPLQIKCFRQLLWMFMAAYLSMDIVSMIFAYYMKYYLVKPNLLPLVLGTLLAVEILAIPLYAMIAKRTSKTRAYIIGSLVWSVGGVMVFFLPATAPSWTIFAMAALIGAGVSAAAVMPHTIFGDVTDVGELAFGERREGNFSGLITFARKLASGVAIALVTAILGWMGYLNPVETVENGVRTVTEQVQPSGVLLAIRIVLAFVPIALLVVGIWAASRFPLDSKTHGELIAFLGKQRQKGKGKKTDPSSEAEREALVRKLV